MEEISQLSNSVVALGGGTPCNDLNMKRIQSTGFSFFINPSAETIVDRLKNETTHRPLLTGKTDEELNSFIQNKLNERMKYYLQADYTVNSEDVVNVISEILKD